MNEASPLISSPFRVKGLLFQATRLYFEQNVVGGYDALLDALPEPLRAFMEQPFLAGARYEALVVPELIEVEADVAGLTVAEYLRQRTRFQAQRDLSGIYRLLVRVAPARVIIRRVNVVMIQMFNFGSVRVSELNDGCAVVELTGIPDPLADWLERCVGLYGEIALQLGGSVHAHCQTRERVPCESVQGYPASALAVEARWR